MAKPEKLTRDEIQSSLHGLVSDAVTYLESELSPARAVATEYYQGKKFGNEETGRSQVVLTDVRDTVLAMLSSLVRLFLPTSGHVIEYQPRPKDMQHVDEAVAIADQATEFINGVVLDQDNDGFLEIHAAFKDALVRAAGWIKFWWEDKSTYKDYTAKGLDVLQLESLLQDPDVKVTKQSERQVDGVMFYDLEYEHWRREGFARLACTPPEEVLISRDARSLADATFIAHRTDKTRSELIAMGVPASEIDEYGGPSVELRQSIEEIARRGGIAHTDKPADEAGTKSMWIEAYPYLDIDGDGIAELVRVNCLGPDCHIVGDPEPIDVRPFAYFCPDPEPHVLIGQSVAQRVMDLQLWKSSLVRAANDGLSMSIFKRRYFMEGVVDQQAMQSTAVGQDIAVRDGIRPAEAIMVENMEWNGRDALDMLSYADTIKQQRIGPLPATLDPDSLQSTPEVGVKATVQAASEQLELIARVFAATGMKQLGKGLLKLLVENQPRERIVRLRNQYVPVDPRAWDAEMDVSVHVALGTEQKLGVLAATAADQFQILSTLGPVNPVCGVGQYVHTRKTMLQLQGIQDTGKYYNDLPINWQPPPAPPQQDPNQLIAQAEVAKAQAQIAEQQAKLEQKRVELMQKEMDLHAQSAIKTVELGLQRENMHLTDERERDKSEADIALRAAEINAKYGTTLTIAQIEAQMREQEMHTEAQTAKDVAALKGNGKPKKKRMVMKRGGQEMTVDVQEEG